MIAKLIGRTGAVAGKEFVLPEVARIGAMPESEVPVRAEGVSRSHARVFREGDVYWLEDAGSTNGTFLNGDRITRDRIRHLDVVTLGRDVDLIFVCRADAPRPSTVGVLTAFIDALDGPDAGASIEIPKGEITLGRASSCTIAVDSAAVSKIHARIQRSSDQVTIQDLASANGTFVNDKRISSVMVLSSRDKISLAGVRSFQMKIARDAAAPQPADLPATASAAPVFNQDWKTRLVWSAEELKEFEAARQSAMAAAAPAPVSPPVKPKAAAAGVPEKPAVARPVQPPVAKPPAAAVSTKPPAPPAAGPLPAKQPQAAPPPAAPAPAVSVKPVVSGTATPEQDAKAMAKPGAARVPPAGAAPSPTPRSPEPETFVDPRTLQVQRPAQVRTTIHGLRLTGPIGTFTVERGTFTVGRGADTAIHLEHREVSRVHAIIVVTTTSATVEDQKSANGTRLNGQGISGPQLLKHGDKLEFGDLGFTVELVLGG